MTLFDIIALLILGVSLLVGLMRGATREVTNVAAFVLAVFVSIFALRFTGPIALGTVHPAWAANTVAVIIVFLAAYLLFRVIGGQLTRTVKHTDGLSLLDRLIGAGFGLVRGLVLLGVIGLLLSAVMSPDHTPSWVANAKLYPLTTASAAALRVLGPKTAAVASSLKAGVDKAHEAEDSGAPAASSAASSEVGQSADSGYKATARKALDDVVEKSH